MNHTRVMSHLSFHTKDNDDIGIGYDLFIH